MPRLKETQEQQKNRTARAYILKNMELYGIKDEQLAIKLCCTKRTFQNKMKRPETFTLGELRRLCLAIKLSDEEKSMLI